MERKTIKNIEAELIQSLRDGCLIADAMRERWNEGDLAAYFRLLMQWRKLALKTIAKAEVA